MLKKIVCAHVLEAYSKFIWVFEAFFIEFSINAIYDDSTNVFPFKLIIVYLPAAPIVRLPGLDAEDTI